MITLLPATLFAIASGTHPQTHAAHDFAHVNAKARSVIDGERALETAALMDNWWRWPGTIGFDKTIDHLQTQLTAAGYVPESEALPGDRLIYRIETYEQRSPAWEPLAATLTIVGEDEPLLSLDTNRNMVAINSHPTPEGGIEVELVDVGSPGRRDWPADDLTGKVVLGRTHAGLLYNQAVQIRGAAGVLAYAIPGYNRARQYKDSIPFTSVGRGRRSGPPEADDNTGFAINLSTRALERLEDALEQGPVRLHIDIQTRTRTAPERVIIAEVRGSSMPDQRFMFSAHVQEPGANDNASGVAAQLEMARAFATLLEGNAIDPQRTVTMLWGDEISAPARYLRQDEQRAAGVRFGMSLDMVGADPAKTGGVFLIEKMPDPSAIWTRGEDEHTEWGGRSLRENDMTPHFFNDFVFNRLADQSSATGWVFDTNPYEGGSDHVPFLRADIPAVLLWHFTDVYYHTDGDRIGNLSADTLANAASSAATCALILASPDDDDVHAILTETLAAARKRLHTEAKLSAEAITAGEDPTDQRRIVQVWADWYRQALTTTSDACIGEPSAAVLTALARAQAELDDLTRQLLASLDE